MAVVDFTLDDVRKIVIKDVTKIIDERFKVFEAGYNEDMTAIQGDLSSIIKRLDVVEHDSASTRRLVGKHSKDIMHLRSIVEG